MEKASALHCTPLQMIGTEFPRTRGDLGSFFKNNYWTSMIDILYLLFFNSKTKHKTQSSSHIWFVNSLVFQSFCLRHLPPELDFQSILMISIINAIVSN